MSDLHASDHIQEDELTSTTKQDAPSQQSALVAQLNSDRGDEVAQGLFTWLTGSAGNELSQLAGGALHAPVFDQSAIDYLERIEEVAKALAKYFRPSVVESRDETPFDQLPEDAQKAVKEQEKADRQAEKDAERQEKEILAENERQAKAAQQAQAAEAKQAEVKKDSPQS